MAEAEVVPSTKKGKAVTLKCEFMLFDPLNMVRYDSGAIIEGEVPAFLLAQVEYGTAELV